MGAPLTEFTIESIIRDGLNELRLNPNRFDDLFSKFTQAFFNNQYGVDKIAELKTYIQNNQIKIVHALSIQPTDMPCISIQMMSSDEMEEDQQFSNMLPEEDEAKTPTVIVPIVTPGTYDAVTGKLTVINAADLSTICPGLIFVDNAGTKFTIGSGNSNLSGNKFINIGKGMEPDLGGDGFIESPIDFKRTDRRMIRLREVISLGCHAANNVHLAKFMYYILVYIIKSRQDAMIARGLHIDRGTASIFDKEGEFEGEHIFSRFVQISMLTEFDWDQSEVNLVDCFDVSIKASSKTADGEEIVDPVNTSG